MKKLVAILFAAIAPLTSGAEVELGMPVPEIELPVLNGEGAVRLADLRGKVVYLDFWASWCGPCRQSLPELNRLRAKYAKDFEVYAINLDEDPADGVRFLEKYPVDYPVVSDRAARFPAVFNVKGMPTSYVLDRDGNLRFVHEGYRSGDAEKIEKIILELIAE